MKKRLSGLKIAAIVAAVMLVTGLLLVGGSVVAAGPKQVLSWLEMPIYVTHDDDGWQMSTRESYAEPQQQVWAADADEVRGLLVQLVDAEMELRAVEGFDGVRLTWYETCEGEYKVELKDGVLTFGHRELSGGVIGVQISDSWNAADIPAFCLEYPAEKEWLSVLFVGVDADVMAEGTLRSRSTSLNLVSGECRMFVQGGNFSVVGMDYDVTARLDCTEATFDGMDVEINLGLVGEERDYSFADGGMDTHITLNKRPLGGESMGTGERKVTFDCMDAEVDMVTIAR